MNYSQSLIDDFTLPGFSENRIILKSMDFQRFCFKKYHEISIINSNSLKSNELLKRLVNENTKYENSTHVTFITYNETIDFMQKAAKETGIEYLPEDIKVMLYPIAAEALECYNKNKKVPIHLLASLIKLKIIDVMYNQYSNKVKAIYQFKNTEEELMKLMRDPSTSVPSSKDKKTKDKGKELDKRAKTLKEASAPKLTNIQDFTKIPLTEGAIIKNKERNSDIWQYLLRGFYDPYLIQELISNNVPITSAIQVTKKLQKNRVDECHCIECSEVCGSNSGSYFWNELYKLLYIERQPYLENTLLLNFEADIGSVNDDKGLLEQLLQVIKSSFELKLHHMDYINQFDFIEIEDKPENTVITAFSKYSNKMNLYPYECITIPLIVDSILDEVCYQMKEEEQIEDISEAELFYDYCEERELCKCPFSIKTLINKKNFYTHCPKKTKKTYQVHEKNDLLKIANSYKYIGSKINDINYNYFKKNGILLNNIDYKFQEIKHFHNRANSKPQQLCLRKDEINFLTNSIYAYSIKCRDLAPKETQDDPLSDYLMKHNPYHDYIKQKPKVSTQEDGDKIVNHSRVPKSQNLYEYRSIHYYNWEEPLSSAVLLQEIENAYDNYICVDTIYSEETDCIIARFHDNLDSFGINTKLYHDFLRSPICLRDFAKYGIYDFKTLQHSTNTPSSSSLNEFISETKSFSGYQLAPEYLKYAHLIYGAKSISEKSENAVNKNTKDSKKDSIKESLKEDTSETILSKLLNYPLSDELKNICISSENAHYIAYDLGSKRVQLTGTKTTFKSLDGVTIQTDTSDFMGTFNFNLSVNIVSDNNRLILNRDKKHDDVLIRLITSKGTTIVLNKPNSNEEVTKIKSGIKPKPSTHSQLGEFTRSMRYSMTTNQKSPVYNYKMSPLEEEHLHGTQVERNTKLRKDEQDKMLKSLFIIAPHDNKIKNINVESLLETLSHTNWQNKNFLLELSKAIDTKRLIYKLHSKLLIRKSPVKIVKNEIQIPVFNIIKKIILKDRRNKCKQYVRKFVRKDESTKKSKPVNSNNYNFCITVLNGLQITSIPSAIFPGFLEIKQKFLSNLTLPRSVKNEEYRLFCRNGYVLIRYPDGGVKILKPNGDVLHYSKPHTENSKLDECEFGMRVHNCYDFPRCKTIYDCQKQLKQIFKRHYENHTAFISRRAQIVKQTAKYDKANNKELCDLPYLKYSLLQLEGKYICLNMKTRKITQEQQTHLIYEYDHITEEKLYERDDGLKMLLEKSGMLSIQFPDNTRIISWYEYEDPITISPKSEEWVSVVLNCKFEHPYYASIKYDNQKDEIEVFPNKYTRIYKNNMNTYEISLSNLTMVVESEKLSYTKRCMKCNRKFECEVNLQKLFKYDESDALILKAHDSYYKEFEFYGKYCTINSNYIQDEFNKEGCNHYKMYLPEKIFTIKSNYTGSILWHKHAVEEKLERSKTKESSRIIRKYSKSERLEILTTHYKHFNERFVNFKLIRENLHLTKNECKQSKIECYVTFRELFHIVDIYKIRKIFKEIEQFVTGDPENTIKGTHSYIQAIILDINEKSSRASELKIKRDSVAETEPLPDCNCIQIHVTFKQKIDNWRETKNKYLKWIKTNYVPDYFSSEYYKGPDVK